MLKPLRKIVTTDRLILSLKTCVTDTREEPMFLDFEGLAFNPSCGA